MKRWPFPVVIFLLVAVLGIPSSFASPVVITDGEGMARLISVASSARGSLLTAPGPLSYNASLVSQIVFQSGGTNVLTTTKSYDNLNRLTSVSSVTSGLLPVASFSYQYNAANQRTLNTLEDGSYWQYTYDSLGQVTGGKKYFADNSEVGGEQFGYAFDSIGNRTSTDVNGRKALYTANALNQYTKRTVPGAVDVSGTAATNATVTVNGQAVSRQGDYFWKELSINNSAGAACPQVTATAAGVSSTNLIAEASGKVFLSKNPERFAYDADGNLISDGRFSYGWDGENRLIAMEALSGVPAEAKRKLEFGYDFLGRRIQKKVYGWSGSAWSLTGEHRFVYDGWNCIGILNSNFTLLTSFVWGLDLSGSMQGAGGVGGLLAVSQQSNGLTHFVAMDGNGNVAALVNADTGAVSAEYEYGPFGEPLRATGPMAKLNPFRFSTKYTDSESGLLYYGYRYLNASTGRWLSRDSIGESGGLNLYAYVNGDPINYLDNNGLWPTKIHNSLIDKAFPNLTASQRTILKAASAKADSLFPGQLAENSHKHAMSQKGEPCDKAAEKFTDFLIEQQMKARNLDNINKLRPGNGKGDEAMSAFGEGLHAVADGTSPSHGGFQPWESEHVISHHNAEKSITGSQADGTVQLMRQYYQTTFGRTAW